jgi:hypothetical protein
MHKSTISKKMNLLYVAVNPDLYKHYAGNKAYPDGDYPIPNKVSDVPDYTGAVDSNDRTAKKYTHRMALKKHNNVVTMNAALINTFLELISIAFK